MTPHPRLLPVLLIAVFATAALAHHAPGHAAAGSVAGAKVDSTLAWLAGHWSNGEGDNRVEELWLEPRGGAISSVASLWRVRSHVSA